MSKIQMHLTLTLNIPDQGLNVNGLLHGLNKSSGSIMLTLVNALFIAIEEKTIEELQLRWALASTDTNKPFDIVGLSYPIFLNP